LQFLKFGPKKIGRADVNYELGKYFNAILHYQVRKLSERSLELMLVKGPSFKTQFEKAIAHYLKNLVGDTVTIRIRFTDVIRHALPGKPPIFVDASKK